MTCILCILFIFYNILCVLYILAATDHSSKSKSSLGKTTKWSNLSSSWLFLKETLRRFPGTRIADQALFISRSKSRRMACLQTNSFLSAAIPRCHSKIFWLSSTSPGNKGSFSIACFACSTLSYVLVWKKGRTFSPPEFRSKSIPVFDGKCCHVSLQNCIPILSLSYKTQWTRRQ